MVFFHLSFYICPKYSLFMERRYMLFFFVSMQVCLSMSAQEKWSAKDSLWLRRVLSGEEKVKLNDEALRAIRSGTFISTPSAADSQMKNSPLELPLDKTFDGIVQPQTHRNFDQIPPSVFILYDLNANPNSLSDTLSSSGVNSKGSCMFSEKDIEEFNRIKKMKVYPSTVTDKQTIPGMLGVGFDAEDLLRTIFWKSHRAKKHNARHARAYKSFSVAPPSKSHLESERRRLNEYINKLKKHVLEKP